MKLTAGSLRQMKADKAKIACLTAYDFWSAKLLDETGIPLLLVGDSLGMVMLGHATTLPVTMEDILHHTRAVVRGASRALVVADLPFLSYQISVEEAVRHAGQCLKEAGADAVKLEGGRDVLPQVRAMVRAGIPVMGHLGLTPQSILTMGGYKVQGRTPEAAKRVLEDAAALEDAGIFALVLECVPRDLAAAVTRQLSVPTIGIGAGPDCDGQILVTHDLLGLTTWFQQPKFTKRFADLPAVIAEAVRSYRTEVEEGRFPADEHTYR